MKAPIISSLLIVFVAVLNFGILPDCDNFASITLTDNTNDFDEKLII